MFCRPTDRARNHHPRDQQRREARAHHPDLTKLRGWKAMQAEGDIPGNRWGEERISTLRMRLTRADSIVDQAIPISARSELRPYTWTHTIF